MQQVRLLVNAASQMGTLFVAVRGLASPPRGAMVAELASQNPESYGVRESQGSLRNSYELPWAQSGAATRPKCRNRQLRFMPSARGHPGLQGVRGLPLILRISYEV